LNFFDIFSKKGSNIKLLGSPSIGNRVLTWERTDRQTDKEIGMTKLICSRFSQFCERA